MTDFAWLEKIVKARTPGHWFSLNAEQYHNSYSRRRCVIVTHNGEGPIGPAEEQFICTIATLADKLMDVVRAADNFCTRCEHQCRNPADCWICDMNKALAALQAAGEEK